jgi:hypothetical protein
VQNYTLNLRKIYNRVKFEFRIQMERKNKLGKEKGNKNRKTGIGPKVNDARPTTTDLLSARAQHQENWRRHPGPSRQSLVRVSPSLARGPRTASVSSVAGHLRVGPPGQPNMSRLRRPWLGEWTQLSGVTFP